MTENKQTQRAKESIRHLMVSHGERLGATISKAYLVHLGETFKPMYLHVRNEDEAERRLNTYLNNLSRVDPEEADFLRHSLRVPDNRIALPGSSRWYNCNLPVIKLTEAQVREFVAFDESPEKVVMVTPPFAAFYIEFPDNILYVEGLDKKMASMNGIFVHTLLVEEDYKLDDKVIKAGLKWRWMAVTNTPTVQWQSDRAIAEMLMDDTENGWEGIGPSVLSQYDHLLNRAIVHVICETCLMMRNRNDIGTEREKVIFPPNLPRRTMGDVYYNNYWKKAEGN